MSDTPNTQPQRRAA